MSPGGTSWPRRWSARRPPPAGQRPPGRPRACPERRFPQARPAKDGDGVPDAARACPLADSGHAGQPRPGRDDPTRRAGDMNTVIVERDAATGRTRPAPAIPDLTLPQFVLGSAYRRGSKRALIDAATGHELSYAGLADAVRETGAGLSARGVRPGDVLALCTPNCIESVVALYAATSIGAIVTTVNPLCTGDEICGQLRQTGARWLVATSGLVEQKLGAVIPGTAIVETFVIGEPAA